MEYGFQNLGAHPSQPDYRDHKDASVSLGSPYPGSFNTALFDVYDQHKIGQCTDNLAEYVSWLYWKKTGVYVKLSRRFLHIVTKNIIDQNDTEGSSLRNTLKAAYNYGICTEAMMPSDVTDATTYKEFIDIKAVPNEAWADAQKYKIGGYIAIPTSFDEFRIGLSKYGLLYSRMEVGREWWTSPTGENTYDPAKMLPIRPPAAVISGHAWLHKAYSSTSRTGRNSWGSEWANNGEGNHLENYRPTECWAVTLDRIVNDLPKASDFKHEFKTAMQRSDRNDEVKNLQIALMIMGDLDFVQAIDRGYYGALTQEAVYKYQLRKNLPLSFTEKYIYRGRYAGAKTLAALNKDFAPSVGQ